MVDPPPTDPADHSEDFAHRYHGWIDYVVSQRMLDLGVPPERIGAADHEHGIVHAAFHPHFRNAGGISPDGRITIESGLFNPTLMDSLGPAASRVWAGARLSVRLDAVIAHEYEEAKGGSHQQAVENAVETELPIREGARTLLRSIRRAELGS